MESLRQAAILLVNDHVDLKLLRDEVYYDLSRKRNIRETLHVLPATRRFIHKSG